VAKQASRCNLDAQHARLLDRQRPTTSPRWITLYFLMMAISPPCVMTTGSFVFWEAALHEGNALQMLAETRLPFCASKIF